VNRKVFSCSASAVTRVTRLGEISPLGQLLALSSFFKITKFGATFVHEKFLH
jgi:hypothetical protein